MKASPTDPMPLGTDPPHIRIRTLSDDATGRTTSALTIDYFTSEDDGTYHCQASNGADTEMSTLIQFTGQYFNVYLYGYLSTAGARENWSVWSGFGQTTFHGE